ncbi:hypothetical protein [Paenibacillus sp.]|jgi:hypothetical protein|uniref:hypothetical protein n=1 Tax=Paenibacillus sp. TaxID=58172 RepID=UPI002825BD65|nr:hypothetical protein [Paenibacillus sp.]MDR0271235.1 hypothetical protein [Paenibacillus sp.]
MDEENIVNATFYHYKLIKKIPVTRIQVRCYLLLPYIAIIAELFLFSWMSLFYFAITAPLVLWIHYVISRSVLLLSGSSYHKRWKFSMRLPWIGYITDQNISFRMFRKVYTYVTGIGLVLFLIFLLMSPFEFVVSLLFWHLWLLLPRFYAFARLSGLRKDGMIKFNNQDISYYQQ